MITLPKRYRQTDRQTDRWIDRQTTCNLITALCVASCGKKGQKVTPAATHQYIGYFYRDIFPHVLLVRINQLPLLKNRRRPQQSGFSAGRSTTDHHSCSPAAMLDCCGCIASYSARYFGYFIIVLSPIFTLGFRRLPPDVADDTTHQCFRCFRFEGLCATSTSVAVRCSSQALSSCVLVVS